MTNSFSKNPVQVFDCVVCYEEKQNPVICGTCVAQCCKSCSLKLKSCPICRGGLHSDPFNILFTMLIQLLQKTNENPILENVEIVQRHLDSMKNIDQCQRYKMIMDYAQVRLSQMRKQIEEQYYDEDYSDDEEQ